SRSSRASDDRHWAFRPPERIDPPVANDDDDGWASTPVDRFIARGLREAGLAPSPPADRRTLIRRLWLDLLGLPPSADEIEAFAADDRPDAWERLVDRALASPEYGERWARHWLDVVRFAESTGFETNLPRPNAWPYRDWLIRALNDDLPYDEFVIAQIAGDAFGIDAATGFLVGGPNDVVKSPDLELTLHQRANELHDIVATTGSAFLGLTVGCARCHYHKFDPISQVDYYRMTAVFAGVQHGEREWRSENGNDRDSRREALARRLLETRRELARFEPVRLDVVVLDGTTHAGVAPDRPRTELLRRPTGRDTYAKGSGRGEANDPGDAERLPNLGGTYAYWDAPGEADLVAWRFARSGKHRIWVSWAARTHGSDGSAQHILDDDGDLTTTDDQRVLLLCDQSRFATGEAIRSDGPLFSGFRDLGVHTLTETSALVLRASASAMRTTAGVVIIRKERFGDEAISQPALPVLRPAVNARENLDAFPPRVATAVRFRVFETNSHEPCIDELEVLRASDGANVALASLGARASSSSDYEGDPKHRLEHVHDGLYGNGRSWISGERGAGWVSIELPEPVVVSAVAWARDRQGVYADRLATRYAVELRDAHGKWETVATSFDRAPPGSTSPAATRAIGLSSLDASRYEELVVAHRRIIDEIRALSESPKVYAGVFTTPEPTHVLYRGDPLEKEERVSPGGIESVGALLELDESATDQERRLALA
ncbi:MAG TPA: DUF1549 domain-containing protein, partial [Planctomycetota bacterium]|nr:DUF1549 domain-containing protein [Planctomycetota bacterium]